MMDLVPLLEARRDRPNEQAALVTVVEVIGSAFRRPGARMLVFEDGSWQGAVSSGCLESDLAERARRVIATGDPELADYELGDMEEPVWGLGMGCPGNVRALLTPFGDEDIGLLTELEDPQQEGILVTLFALREEKDWRAPSAVERWQKHIPLPLPEKAVPFPDSAAESLHEVIAGIGGRSEAQVVEVEWEGGIGKVLLEHIRPHPRLLIHGAGPGSAVLAALGNTLGWKVTVADHRPDRLQPAAFPDTRLVICHDVANEVPALDHPDRTAVVVMTHHWERDRALLERYLPDRPRYLGLMSSRSRRDDLLEELSEEQRVRTEGILHSPMGLDLGAERPEEMALATAAEIQAVLRDASGGRLRDREGPVHRRD